MDDLISRQAILDMLEDINNHIIDGYGYKHDWCVEWVKGLPSIDAVPVIRCKDCKWWTKQEDSLQGRCALHGMYPTGEWFCANARREEE